MPPRKNMIQKTLSLFRKKYRRKNKKYNYKNVGYQKIYKTIHKVFTSEGSSFDSTAGGLTPAFGSNQFALNDLNNVANYTALYDFFRIDKIVVQFIPCRMTQNTDPMSRGNAPMLMVGLDFNDNATPTTIDQVLHIQGVKIVPAYKSLKLTFVPRVSDTVYGPITSGYSEGKHLWIATSDPDTPFYGIKYCLTDNNGPPVLGVNDVNWGYQIYCTYFISFKGLRTTS